MKSRDFCYWLQGLFELGDPKELNAQQTELIKRHLDLVFKHEIDPSMGPPDKQAELNEIHGPRPPHLRPGWSHPTFPSDVVLRC